LIKSQQLGEKIVVAGREHSFGQSYGCVLAGLLGEIGVGDLLVHPGV
jgi:hypothetical protein